MNRKKNIRRSGAKIMASLILLLGNLAYIMVLAVINGSAGFICAMGVTLMGAVGIAKALGKKKYSSAMAVNTIPNVVNAYSFIFFICTTPSFNYSPLISLKPSPITSATSLTVIKALLSIWLIYLLSLINSLLPITV